MSEASVSVVSFVISATNLRGGYRYPRASQVAYPSSEGYVTVVLETTAFRLAGGHHITRLNESRATMIFSKLQYNHEYTSNNHVQGHAFNNHIIPGNTSQKYVMFHHSSKKYVIYDYIPGHTSQDHRIVALCQ